MTWGEVDLDARMKAGLVHEAPLSDAAIAILMGLKEEGLTPKDYVFPAPRGGFLSDIALSQLLKRMDRPDITVQGFRSTFREKN